MSGRAAKRLAWGVWTTAMATFAAGLALSLLSDPNDALESVPHLAIVLVAATVGALVLARVPGNPIGWILGGVAVHAGLSALAGGYAERYLAGDGGSRSLAEAGAWLSNWAWIPLVFVLVTFVPLYFPSGRLPSRRWRIVAWCAGLGTAGYALSEAFSPGRLADYPRIVNPYGIDHVAVDILGAGFLFVLAAAVASAVSIRVRYRRATGVERQQVKWLAYAGSLAAGTFVAGFPIGGFVSEDLANGLILAGLLTLPVAVGIAVLRYRLYDIDVVVNRTLVYGSLTALLAGTYVGLVLVFQLALSPVTDGSGVTVAASTLAVAALFRPARARIQDSVDRRFYRRRYDAARTLERFGARLREEVDLDALVGELRAAVAETVQPAHVSLWLRSSGARR